VGPGQTGLLEGTESQAVADLFIRLAAQ
jgi:hypothetical protein